MNNHTIRRLRPMLPRVSHVGRRGGRRVPPCDPPAARLTLDRGSVVPLCAVCIESGRVTEATYQTSDHLCGCDRHIHELEQYGRAAIRRQRKRTARDMPEQRDAVSAARARRSADG
jgi:hypothetical protein